MINTIFKILEDLEFTYTRKLPNKDYFILSLYCKGTKQYYERGEIYIGGPDYIRITCYWTGDEPYIDSLHQKLLDHFPGTEITYEAV